MTEYPKSDGSSFYEKDLTKRFEKEGIRFDGKRCLNIGSNNKLDNYILIRLGAEQVIINKDIFDVNNIEQFDVITFFLWDIGLPRYDEIMLQIKSLLKPDGILYIRIHGDFYKYDKYGGSVISLLHSNFDNVRILKGYETTANKDRPWILEAKNPCN